MISLNKSKLKSVWWIGLALFCAMLLWSGRQEYPAQDLSFVPVPSWRGITPGQTMAQEAITLLGQPDTIVKQDGYEVYRYRDREEMGWQEVELWVSNEVANLIVGVFRSSPYLDRNFQSLSDVQSLEQLVIQYRRPDKVTWATLCKLRYLIWARHGVIAMASGNADFRSWDELNVGEILLIQPATVEEITQRTWPWPAFRGWADQNYCTDDVTDAPDVWPEDPYNWGNIP